MEVKTYLGTRWQDWFSMILGTWVYITPWVLGVQLSSTAAWVAWIFGLLVIAVATWALAVPDSQWPEVAQLLLAALLCVSPWVFSFTNLGAFYWNAWIAGIVLSALSVWALATLHQEAALWLRAARYEEAMISA
jgi:hypothetical protein